MIRSVLYLAKFEIWDIWDCDLVLYKGRKPKNKAFFGLSALEIGSIMMFNL